MDLIENYLKEENIFDSGDIENAPQDEKLECFFSLFTGLERKYNCCIDDMHQLELEHKEELNQLQSHVYQVKQLTEEREKLTIDYKDENEELKLKIKAIEGELAQAQKNKKKLTNDSSILSDDDLSEATVEMLVIEGFGNIVGAPNHEKIAVLLHDRSQKAQEITELKQKASQHKLDEKLETLEMEIESLKLANEKLTSEMSKLKTQNANLEEINKENEIILTENIGLKKELNKLNKEFDKISLSNLNNEDDNAEASAIIEANRVEISKLKEDNLNLKMEIDRLYDEIGSFETDNKQLRDQTKAFQKQLDSQNDNQPDLNGKDSEIKNLKQEIDDLNEELDELIQFKANYESLKLDYDKLNAQVQLNNSQGDLALKSPSKSNLTPSSSFRSKSQIDGSNVEEAKSKLELEWIRGENEKLLLDLEKVQEKLDEKTHSYNLLKEQLVEKDEQMNEFINKYQKNQTDNNDLLNLQKKVLDLEHSLSNEKEEKILELESNEERQKDLLKRNDSLWSQLTNMEQNYKDTVDIVRQQTDRIQELEDQVLHYDTNATQLDDQIKCERTLNESLASKFDDLKAKLAEAEITLNEKNEKIAELIKEHSEEANQMNLEIKSLNENITNLTNQLSDLKQESSELKQKIESLNKEKTFIIDQNENSHSKVMQDYLLLQEKHTDVNYQFNKLTKDYAENMNVIKEKEQSLMKLRNCESQLEFELKKETREKNEAFEKVNYLESLATKNVGVINDLSDKLHKVELQKAKLEIKAKELDTLGLKCDQIFNELNDKRETLSEVLEKNGKLEGQINNLELKLNESKHSLIHSETVINELSQYKVSSAQKTEENITIKHDFENEKLRRENAEKKLEEFKEDFKKLKSKQAKTQEDNSLLKTETIEIKNQLDGFKSKINFIADKSHTELEKNTALQDELSELKKKLELADVKCANYSEKFDLLLKKYETRKIRQKNKVERLWEYLQRERVKYKNLLANAQNDLTTTKTFLNKESEFKTKNENTNQQLIEEKSKLIATVADKDIKLRELKRLNHSLNSKIKLLEEEMESLNDRVELTLKERNRYRKEIQLNLLTPVSTEYLGSPKRNKNKSIIVSNLTRPLLMDPNEGTFKSSSMISSSKYWNDLNNGGTTVNWDVNYNTGIFSKYTGLIDRPSYDLSSTNSLMINSNKNAVSNKLYDNGESNFGGSVATDLNSSSSTPRSLR